MTKKKSLYFIIIVLLCLAAGYFFVLAREKHFFTNSDSSGTKNSSQEDQPGLAPSQDVEFETAKNQDTISQKTSGGNPSAINRKIEQKVPFIVQAPFGNWKDPNFQNGCEEASVIMAMGWVNGEGGISQQDAQKRILEIVDFENRTFGYSIDTNASDVERIFQEYFSHKKVKAREDITLEDIKAELQAGNLVIVPVFGRALGNPNFVQPGPIAHMLVIIGYDPSRKEFITNDPGTRKGAGYKYEESLLFSALWEYSSGNTEPPLPTAGKMKKALISVSK